MTHIPLLQTFNPWWLSLQITRYQYKANHALILFKLDSNVPFRTTKSFTTTCFPRFPIIKMQAPLVIYVSCVLIPYSSKFSLSWHIGHLSSLPIFALCFLVHGSLPYIPNSDIKYFLLFFVLRECWLPPKTLLGAKAVSASSPTIPKQRRVYGTLLAPYCHFKNIILSSL